MRGTIALVVIAVLGFFGFQWGVNGKNPAQVFSGATEMAADAADSAMETAGDVAEGAADMASDAADTVADTAEGAAATFGWTFLFSAALVPAMCRADIFTGSIMVPS